MARGMSRCLQETGGLMVDTDVLVPSQWVELLRGGGVARVAPTDVATADLEEWAAGTDRGVVMIDTQDCATERELILALAASFGFADDECDWDELDECLGDHDVAPAAGLIVVWSGWEGLHDDDEEAVATAVDALATAAQTWGDEGRPWAVLVSGDGPSWQLPWLGVGPAPWDLPDGADDVAGSGADGGDDSGPDDLEAVWGASADLVDDPFDFVDDAGPVGRA